MLKKEIGLRIKQIRESKHMSKEEFAKILEVSGQYLGIVEHGKSCLSVEKLQKLCDYTHLSADYILFGKDFSLPAETKSMLEEYSDDELLAGCKVLGEFAKFIKHVG